MVATIVPRQPDLATIPLPSLAQRLAGGNRLLVGNTARLFGLSTEPSPQGVRAVTHTLDCGISLARSGFFPAMRSGCTLGVRLQTSR